MNRGAVFSGLTVFFRCMKTTAILDVRYGRTCNRRSTNCLRALVNCFSFGDMLVLYDHIVSKVYCRADISDGFPSFAGICISLGTSFKDTDSIV